MHAENKTGEHAKDQVEDQSEDQSKGGENGQLESLLACDYRLSSQTKDEENGRLESLIERESFRFAYGGVCYRFVRWHASAGEGCGSVADSAPLTLQVPGAAALTLRSPEAAALADRPCLACSPRPIRPSRPNRPIVLLHGFAQSALSWDGIARHLARHRFVYALDFVGHGESEQPGDQAPYEMNAACEALLAFLRFVQCEQGGLAPVVVGYSMGGRIALASAVLAVAASSALPMPATSPVAPALAADTASAALSLAPAHASASQDIPFATLVLESAGLGPASSEEREALARRNRENARRVQEEGVAEFMDAWECLPLFATQRALPENVRLLVRSQRLSNNPLALARTFLGTGAQCMPSLCQSLDALAALCEKGIAVHYLAGELDDKYVKVAKALAREHAKVHFVPQAGHNAHLENPKAFLQVLEKILALPTQAGDAFCPVSKAG